MLARLRSLLHVSDYRQAAGRHPTPIRALAGQERIELVTDGRGWVQHEGAWHAVAAGDLLWECAGDWTIGRSD
ncbi:MAG: hypothetical protein H0W72_02825, partial [Planctomycetes bacterium]|nr:hypothetical protein [Planctomycetota bacterium]